MVSIKKTTAYLMHLLNDEILNAFLKKSGTRWRNPFSPLLHCTTGKVSQCSKARNKRHKY